MSQREYWYGGTSPEPRVELLDVIRESGGVLMVRSQDLHSVMIRTDDHRLFASEQEATDHVVLSLQRQHEHAKAIVHIVADQLREWEPKASYRRDHNG